jgi:peptidoglycan endopeptidase LytF
MNEYDELVEYAVQPGDTLWDLAGQYDTTVDDIMMVNPEVDPDNLQVGQVIMIPDTQQAYASQRPGEGRREERRPGERRPEERRPGERRPGERRPGERRPGERLPEFRRPPYRPPYRPYRPPYQPYYPYYPSPVACPAGATPYAVQPGDSLYNIASRFGVSVDAIIAINPYINFGIPLQIGQVICLPV